MGVMVSWWLVGVLVVGCRLLSRLLACWFGGAWAMGARWLVDWFVGWLVGRRGKGGRLVG